MWLDVIGLVVLGLFVLMGLLRGTLASFMRVVSLVLAYGTAIALAPVLGPVVAEQMSLPQFLGLPIAGSLVFAVNYLILGVIAQLVQLWERRQRRGRDRSTPDRVGGAVLGGVQGAFIMLLIGWLGLWIDAGHQVGSLQSLPDTSRSALSKATQAAVEKGGATMVNEDDTGARVALKVVAHPKKTILAVQRILESPRIQSLQNDPLFWRYVESGAIDTALNQGSFLGIAYDDTLRREFADVGLIDRHAATDPRLFRNEAREALEEIAPRLQRLKGDPVVRELMKDPEVVAALQAGDHLALLRDARFRELVSRVLEGSPSQN